MQLASINGVEVGANTKDEEIDKLTKRIEELEAKLENIGTAQNVAPKGTMQLLATCSGGSGWKSVKAPGNGWIKFSLTASKAVNREIGLQIGSLNQSCVAPSNFYWGLNCSLPCFEGQTVQYICTGAGETRKFIFYSNEISIDMYKKAKMKSIRKILF